MMNKDYFSLFMDFRESLTLALLQSGLNTRYQRRKKMLWPTEQRLASGLTANAAGSGTAP
jgi:hypothetical protein